MEEEYKSNASEESERYRNAKAGSSWLGKVISNTFDYSGKSDFDFQIVEARDFVTSKVDSITRADILYEDQRRHIESTQPKPIVIELSLCDNDSLIDDMEESKLYN